MYMLSLYKLPALKINENKVRNPFNELMCNCVRLRIRFRWRWRSSLTSHFLRSVHIACLTLDYDDCACSLSWRSDSRLISLIEKKVYYAKEIYFPNFISLSSPSILQLINFHRLYKRLNMKIQIIWSYTRILKIKYHIAEWSTSTKENLEFRKF